MEHVVTGGLDLVVPNVASVDFGMQANRLHSEAIAIGIGNPVAGTDVNAPVGIEEVVVMNIVA